MKYLRIILLIFTFTAGLSGNSRAQLGLLSKVPGNFAVDFGFTQLNGLPAGLESDLLASRTISLSYMFRLRLGNGGFSLHPGLGYTGDNFSLKGRELPQVANRALIFATPLPGTDRSKLSVNYFDLPVELRWASSFGRDAFRLTAGAKIGVLFNTHSKYSGEFAGKSFDFKEKGDFYLEPFRAGFYARAGYSWFNVYYYQSLTNVFQKDRMPGGEAVNAATFGISMVSF